MATVVLTIHLLLALSLIIVVLLQRSEGGGLGIGGGGGGVMSGRSAATALSKLTWALGVGFVVTSLALTVIAARDMSSGSVIDRVAPTASETAPEADAGSTPDLGGDLLPPMPSEGPATPPPVE
jgi:preprotein translocase subunit SecG